MGASLRLANDRQGNTDMNMLRKILLDQARDSWAAYRNTAGITPNEKTLAELLLTELYVMNGELRAADQASTAAPSASPAVAQPAPAQTAAPAAASTAAPTPALSVAKMFDATPAPAAASINTGTRAMEAKLASGFPSAAD